MVLEAANFCFQTLLLTTATDQDEFTAGKPNYSFVPTSTCSTKVIRASQQVVAGMNFHLTCLVQDSDESCLGAFSATVYNRFGELSVTKWGQEHTCAEVKAFMESEAYSDTEHAN